MAPSLTLRDGDLLPYLIGIAAGTAATAGAGIPGSAGAAILVVFCRIATRFLSERFGWPQANDEKSLPLLSGAARDVAFEDELAVLRSLVERLTKENATLVEENATLRHRAAQPRARSVRLPEAAEATVAPSAAPAAWVAIARKPTRSVSRLARLEPFSDKEMRGSSSGSSNDPTTDPTFKSRLGSRMATAAIAERVAAEAEASESSLSSQLHVTIENDADETCTVVRIMAPNRARLLADLSSALSGLGLSIVKAQIATIGTRAQNTFFLQEVVYPEGGRKVWGTERLSAIEGRLRQFFRNQAMQRLLKAKTLGDLAEAGAPRVHAGRHDAPSWAQLVESLPSSSGVYCGSSAGAVSGAEAEAGAVSGEDAASGAAAGEPYEARLLAGLAAAFRSEWGGTRGALPPSLAHQLARDVLPRMARGYLNADEKAPYDMDAEWLLLLEGNAAVTCAPYRPSQSITPMGPERRGFAEPRDSNGSEDLTDLSSSDRRSSGLTDWDVDTSELTLGPGTVLWSLAHTLDGGASLTPPSLTPPGGASLTPYADETPNGIAHFRWYGLRCPPGTARVPLRLLHKSQLRSLLVSLRETLAHAHAAKLAELPLFAPLTTNELLALCRRATEVELPPRHNLRPIVAPNLATETALVKPLAPETLPNDAFAVVLSGDVLLVVETSDTSAASAEAAAEASAEAPIDVITLACAASGVPMVAPSGSPNTARPSSPNTAPSELAIHRLSVGSVLGETGQLLPVREGATQGAVMGGGGAVLGGEGAVLGGSGAVLGGSGAVLGEGPLKIRAGAQGCVLLCWRREATVQQSLARLSRLLEQVGATDDEH